MRFRTILLAMVLASCSAAGSGSRATDGAGTLPGEGAGAGAGTAQPPPGTDTPGADPGGVADAGPQAADAGPVRFHIQLDYRFDQRGFFADPTRRTTLEGAAHAWGRALSDSFPDVPAGTYVFILDPDDPYGTGTSFTLEYGIDDLVIFVGSAPLGGGQLALSGPSAGLAGVTDPALQAALDQRYSATPFRPWTGWMSFDTESSFYFDPTPDTPHAPAADKVDFYSVALHEIGHVLGFGTAAAFKALAATGSFTGANARASHGGAAVPLASDRHHVPDTLLSGGHRLLMNVSFPVGDRYAVTPLDQAFFEDLGYHF